MNAAQITSHDKGELDSYTSAVAGVRAVFGETCLAGSARSCSAELERRELVRQLQNPSGYGYGKAVGGVLSDEYRTGECGGERYMTAEDMRRCIHDGCALRSPDAVSGLAKLEHVYARRNVRTEHTPAGAYRIARVRAKNEKTDGERFASSRSVVYTGKRYTEMCVEKKDPGFVRGFMAWLDRVFPRERIAALGFGARRPMTAVTAVALAVVFAVVFAAPIVFNVIINRTSVEVASLDNALRQKQEEAAALQIELDSKNDLFLIEKLAVEEYGMIRFDETNSAVLRLNGTDMIESFDTEKRNNEVVLALLSALGIRAGDE